ncbi:hypothetical protein KIL84_006394 [Mauremys mutica]|uniref:Uncharacterized protein n=1 Tax=Mauremys mutica TaxID=74926 RepID=A0A9D4AW08_9SAUR|nr:hypothetical protein KIL84_006394 [Mauremys mutica]
MAMSFYKTPTDAKKPELGAPAHVQKRRPIYTYFTKEAAPMLSPVFHPEIEPKKQEDFMGALPVVKEKKDSMCKKLLPALEEADLKAEVGMEEESVYKDMAAERLSEDSDVENQPIDPESWKDGDIVTVKANESFTSCEKNYYIYVLKINYFVLWADNQARAIQDHCAGTSSEDEEEKERQPLRRSTCCFFMKQDLKKKTVKSKEDDQQSCEDDIMADIIRAVVVKTIYFFENSARRRLSHKPKKCPKKRKRSIACGKRDMFLNGFHSLWSEEFTNSELDLFQIAPTQTSIENSFYGEVLPLAALMVNIPLEFFISEHEDHYLDGNNMLSNVCCDEVKEDGSGINTAGVALTNYPIATLFNQMDVTQGDCLIGQSNKCYPYRASIELILNYSHDTCSMQILSGGFYKDTVGAHESTVLDGTGNKGLMRRARLTASSRKLDMLGVSTQ